MEERERELTSNAQLVAEAGEKCWDAAGEPMRSEGRRLGWIRWQGLMIMTGSFGRGGGGVGSKCQLGFRD